MPGITPLWISHHYPEDYDRCVAIGRRHVCRRCLVLYPLAFAVMALSLAGVGPAGAVDPLLVVLLPLPAVIEFVLEHARVLHYRPGRQMALTVLLALGLGRGFAIYLEQPTSVLFWTVVVGYGVICGAAALLAGRGEPPGYAPAMTDVVIYHNPNCSNSRTALELLRQAPVDVSIVQYLKTPLDRATMETLVANLEDPVGDLVRRDKNFTELGLDPADYDNDAAVVELLLAHPALMQRPVVVSGDRTFIARPPAEKLSELLG